MIYHHIMAILVRKNEAQKYSLCAIQVRSNYQTTFRLPKIILIWVHLCLLKSCNNKGNKILSTNVFWDIMVPQKNPQSGVRNSENWVENALVFLCSTESLFGQGNAFFTFSFMLRKWNSYTI